MRTWKIFPLAVAVFVTLCSLADASPPNTSAKTDVALLQYKKIAAIKFKNPKNESSGREAADILALGFLKLGYNVVGSDQIASLINQDDVYSLGLTPEIKSKLKSAGIDSILTGTVNEYFCSGSESILPQLKAGGENHCSATVTSMMLDLDSGEIVWGATGSDAADGKWVTADSVLRSVMQKLQGTIPNLVQLRYALSATGAKPQTPQTPGPPTAK